MANFDRKGVILVIVTSIGIALSIYIALTSSMPNGSAILSGVIKVLRRGM